ncbi:TonB-dependent receptor plug domain-containing protein [Desulfonema magnum]|uniref:TonB-dependent receptor domain-containing protein n=1 Tax=Desulfonema magnum TaxID=45655 RepID=A0A975GNW2_9BACT|nr:TonB-dependent receptor [Desulfonema magnum]QTA87283.1 TonB-dependent receptor domain-containing protein [Desulfonema magnum]
MKTIIRIFILFGFVVINTTQIFAQQGNEPIIDSELDAEFEAELLWLQEEAVVMTEIATKTKMDADMVPGMVTVLRGDDLEIRGIRTVYEALSLVPGLHTYLDTLGDQRVSVRGLGGSFFSGNLKLLLDGIVLNDSLTAAGYVIYGIPVEQVDRIEIIRGPGSVVYGEYACAGVINVMTRKDVTRVYGRCVWDHWPPYGYGGGGAVTYTIPEEAFSLSLHLSGWKSDSPDIETGEDRLYEEFAGMQFDEFSNAPGSTNEAQENRLANLSLKYKGFSLSGQYLLNGRGDYFGMLHILPQAEERIITTHDHRALEAGQTLSLSDAFKLDFKLGWRRYEFYLDNLTAVPPIAISMPDGSVIDITPSQGSIITPYYEEREIYAGGELIWKGMNRHTLLLGMKYSDTDIRDVWVDTNTTEEQRGTMVRLRGEENWFAEGGKRDIFGVYLQDMFDMTDRFTLTLGVRYDRRYDEDENKNEVEDNITPRVSAVWALTDYHILKAQYSESVRPPSFTELYARGNSVIGGNPDLDPEHIRSYELGYIYRRSKTVGRITLFYSELEDNIEYPKYADSLGEGGKEVQYQNADGTIKTKGFELEFEHDLRVDLRFSGSLSFADAEDGQGKSLMGATEWLGNAELLYRPKQDYAFDLQYRYVGKRHRASEDERDDPAAYYSLDLSASIFNCFTKGLTLRGGCKNLSDSEIIFPAPAYKDADGNIGYTYADDFPRPGREWWMQLSYDFD